VRDKFRMFSGLVPIGRLPIRIPKEEFTTHTDPFVLEALNQCITPGQKQLLRNYSRSYYTLDGHMESISKYKTTRTTEPPNNIEWTDTVEYAMQYFRNLPRVTALSANTDFDHVRFHQSTSAGYGYHDKTASHPTHKGQPDGSNHKKAKRIASKIVHEITAAHRNTNMEQYLEQLPNNSTPDISFTRTQLVERPNLKVRNVFGECFHYVLLEGLFAQPLIQKFMSINSFYYIGDDPLLGVPKYVESLSDEQDAKFVTLDWSTFDASVQPYEIELAFDLIESMIDFPDLETTLIFKYVRTLFMKRKLAAPDGQLFMRYGGIPSGSYFTHIVDSIINWNRITYLFRRLKIPIKSVITHGDDSLIELLAAFDSLYPLIEESTPLGWILKPEKIALVQNKSQIEFLGRSVRNGVNYRDPVKCFRLLVYTEYEVTDPQVSIARIKSINSDSGLTLPHVSYMYNYLARKYGDDNKPLPNQFRRFKQNTYDDHVPTSI